MLVIEVNNAAEWNSIIVEKCSATRPALLNCGIHPSAIFEHWNTVHVPCLSPTCGNTSTLEVYKVDPGVVKVGREFL